MTARVRPVLSMILVATLLAGVACGNKEEGASPMAASGAPAEPGAAPPPAAPAPGAAPGSGAAGSPAPGTPEATGDASAQGQKIPLPIRIGEKTIVAKVNGTEITGKELDRAYLVSWRQFIRSGVALPADMQKQVMTELLQAMIGAELIRQQAVKDGLKAEPTAVEERYRKIASGAPSEEQFKAALQKEGLTPDSLRNEIAGQVLGDQYVDRLLAKKASQVNVSEAEAKQFYDKNPQMFERQETVRARHILRKFPVNATEQQKKAERQKIEEALAKVKAGEDFGKVASTYSSDVTAPKGGDLGFFPRGKMVPQFEDVAFSQKPGEVSGVVETRYGFHIIKTEEKIPAGKVEFNQVAKSIIDQLSGEKKQKVVNDEVEVLRAKAKVDFLLIFPEDGTETAAGSPAAPAAPAPTPTPAGAQG